MLPRLNLYDRFVIVIVFVMCSLHHAGILQLPGTHAIGVTAVSWAPAVPSGALVSSKPPGPLVKRLVSSGCDNTIKVSDRLSS